MNEQPSRSSREEYDRIKAFLSSEEGLSMTHDEMEEFLEGRRRTLVRLLYEEYLRHEKGTPTTDNPER